ncbi:photoreceptor outer segment membrane glycoprotein 2 [Anthonomus grandis grandis]|uniref:photoreceptor outer segment membrane glycoprotein 2 n=1 Tax=Anthonomus grandis grandis TaxID=2921223 RepID=UPI0021668D6F|nr:photoreceptor outer segment membrane glycoprotein 2 [Anthonomus grandis grandis]
MAVGLIKLSKKQRNIVYKIFYALNVMQMLFSAGILSSSAYVCLAISPKIMSEKAEINFVFVVYGIFSTNALINWLVGIKICQKCLNQANKKSTRSILLLWYCAGTNTVITLIIIAHLSKKANRHIVKSMKNSIQAGMKNYLTDTEAKELIDKIQYEMQCCGYDTYKDWYDVEWLNDKVINVSSSRIEELRYDKRRLMLPVLPWSCCKLDYPLPCLHDPVQQYEYTSVWAETPQTVQDSLNTDGCVTKLRTPLGFVVESLAAVIGAITLLHVIIILISRILYTSCRNAIMLYDVEGVAPGWIFGRGDCGYARGKTLTEIMGLTNEVLAQRAVEEKRKERARMKSAKSTPSKSVKAVN